MKKKYNLITSLSAILFVLFFVASPALALEATYPRIPMLPEITATSELADYVGYFFGLGIMIGGFLALVSFTIGAIRYMASAGNPTSMGDAKDRMSGALLGLGLLLVSFLIMKTINTSLVSPTLTPLAGVEGIYYYKSDTDLSAVPQTVSDPSEKIKKGYTQIFYRCFGSPNLIIWKYPQKNFGSKNYTDVIIEKIACGGFSDISGAGSFKIGYETPGVYYYLGKDCTGFMSESKATNESTLEEPFKGRIKSVKIFNNATTAYNVIFHKAVDYKGGCTGPIIQVNDQGCSNVYMAEEFQELSNTKNSYFSSTIFRLNTDYNSSGSGVTFFSKTYGYKTGSNAGRFKVEKNDEQFGKRYYWSSDAAKMLFNFESTESLNEEKLACANFQQCAGSIEVGGDYIVLLTSRGKDDGDYVCSEDGRSWKLKTCSYTYWEGSTQMTRTEKACYCNPPWVETGGGETKPGEKQDAQYKKCQVYTNNAPNLNTGEFLGSGDTLGVVQVWPIKK